jgi:hypothetical protein
MRVFAAQHLSFAQAFPRNTGVFVEPYSEFRSGLSAARTADHHAVTAQGQGGGAGAGERLRSFDGSLENCAQLGCVGGNGFLQSGQNRFGFRGG